MEEQFVTTGETPHVRLEVRGNLRLKGSDELEVRAQSDSADDLTLESQGDEVRIRCRSDCKVMVPYAAGVTIDSVHGNAQIKALEGTLAIDNVHGDLDLRNVGLTHLNQLSGNLAAKHIDGEFGIQRVDGNATVQDVLGSFQVSDTIKGNLSLDDVEGDASAKVSGNATLRIDPLPGQTYDFTAAGNIVCRLPADASVKLHIPKAGRVSVNLPGAEIPERLNPPVDLSLGDGEATLNLSANGNVQLSEWTPDWEMSEDFDADFGEGFARTAENIAEQVAQQVEVQMETLARNLELQMDHLSKTLSASGLSPEAAERVSQRAREASARATARAQQKMQLAQERIQRKIEATQRRAEHKARMADRHQARHERRGFEWSASKPGPAGDAVTEGERLVILKMLEEKKISLIEAEQLLAALEGKES